MNFSDYIDDHKAVLLVCLTGGLFFSVLMFSFGIGLGELFLLWVCFLAIILFSGAVGYRNQRKRVQHLLESLDSLDQKYLAAEIVDEPKTELEKVYFHLLKTALKDMTDEVGKARRLNEEYRDFIEQWVHEIKVPITGIRLICENNKTEAMRKIITQTELIGQDVERVLFYARLGSVEKDYLIKEISLKQCVMEVLARNKQFLIQNGVRVEAGDISDTVYADHKWVCFILNQIIFNSMKYRKAEPPVIQIRSQDLGNCVSLSVTDNGIGIKQSELSRVFDKGFVGSNGRAGKNATGMGLYLCDQLCRKLGIGIDISSEAGVYTTVFLYFPKNDHLNL